jgi:hypothetical protein
MKPCKHDASHAHNTATIIGRQGLGLLIAANFAKMPGFLPRAPGGAVNPPANAEGIAVRRTGSSLNQR